MRKLISGIARSLAPSLPELAIQIFNEARNFCYRTALRPGVIYGERSSRSVVQASTITKNTFPTHHSIISQC
ncbi:hypothetical protein CEP54_014795 [Fusarium duplospermum]|uniref:Uncharacterized protein n=1 Tax=Fusarium duplospermum TaxID=1325734 RepID=A0A428NTN2_9HYPO|nr:hypothetical protein CEP54_014795 [Fusarium duplospermum]